MVMYSYVQMEKELSKSYRAELSNVKRPEEIEGIFGRTVTRLLSEITERVKPLNANQVKFFPEKKPTYKLEKSLIDIPEIAHALSNSDLKAIIDRFAEEAKNRYLHLINDDDRTEVFKKSPAR